MRLVASEDVRARAPSNRLPDAAELAWLRLAQGRLIRQGARVAPSAEAAREIGP